MNKYYVYNKDFKIWMHKSPLKLVLNPILRKIQWFTDRPYVIVSQTEFIDDKPNFIKYGIKRVYYIKV